MLISLARRAYSKLPWSTFRSWFAYAALPLVGIITAPILARALGPEGRGQLAAILQPLSVADAFAAMGVPAAVTYFVARGVHPRKLRRSSLTLLSVSSLVVCAGLIAYSYAVSEASGVPQHLLLLLWASTVIGAFIATRRSVWQGLRTFTLLDGERATAAITRLVLIVLLFVIGVNSSFPFALVYVVSGILAATLLFLYSPGRAARRMAAPLGSASQPLFRRRGRGVHGVADQTPPSSLAFTRYAVLASLGSISIMLNNRLDQAALPAAVSARELGFYSVAVTVAEVPLILATVMNRNLLAEVSGKAGRRTVIRTTLTGIGGLVICCIGLAVFASWLVPLAFGSAFTPAVQLVQLLLIGTVLGSVASAASTIVTGLGRPGLGSIGPGFAALVTASLLWISWQEMTVERAAVIAIVAQGTAAVVSSIVLWKITQWGKK